MEKTEPPTQRRPILSPDKMALFERIRSLKLQGSSEGIPKQSGTGPIPLSSAQQRIWFLNELVPHCPAYNVVFAFHFSRILDIGILKKSLNQIVFRHESLRTSFPKLDGKPCQYVSTSADALLAVIDLRGIHENERNTVYSEKIREEARHDFDLSVGPLVRFTYYLLSDDKSILLWNSHHITVDGWSLGVFTRELVLCYCAYHGGANPILPDLSIQYTDYTIWQRKRMKDGMMDSQLAYWKKQLGEQQLSFEIPTDKPRLAVQDFRGNNLKFHLPKELTSSIKELCEREGASLYIVLLAALKIIMHRYSGSNEIVIGSPIAGRNRLEIENLIGFFVNSLAMKTDLSGNPSFIELLHRVKNVANEAYANQDLPFEALVENLHPDRNMSQNPIFQVCFALQNSPMPKNSQDLPNMRVLGLQDIEYVHNDTSKFDLWINLVEKHGIIDGDVEFNSAIFNQSTILRILSSYSVLLEAIVKNPNGSISELPILTKADEHRLLSSAKAKRGSSPEDNRFCLHELFGQQVEKRPESIALKMEGRQLMYGELEDRANCLAEYLIEKGINTGDFIGICMDRSFEMIISILGILKAGGAYVPIDPDCPDERKKFIKEDSGIRLLLTQKALAKRNGQSRIAATGQSEVEVIYYDEIACQLSIRKDSKVKKRVDPDSVAYVIYTSGSTGKPKGVQVSHFNVARLFKSTADLFHFGNHDIWTLFHSYAFDFSVWEIWGALLNGGKLVMVPYWVSRSPEQFYELLQIEKVTVLNQTPSAFYPLVAVDQECRGAGLSSLRFIIFGGEMLNFKSIESWIQRYGDESPKLVNMYGITETTVHVTHYSISRKDLLENKSLIGHPIDDLEIYLLDQYRNLSPLGVPGEIYVGGAGLSKGYLNRPGLTAERFIRNPFSDQVDARLYRSGDSARFLEDGSLEYLGRIDQQVKIRGHRIELEEIESVLEQHKFVRKAAVVAADLRNMHDCRQLFAYIIPETKGDDIMNEMASHRVAEWEEVFSDTYKNHTGVTEVDFNITGWNSSYTGMPFSKEEMKEWVDGTVQRILKLHPKRVLEIGCGTGLLLSRIAPFCEKYIGTDLSAEAIEYVRRNIILKKPDLFKVALYVNKASDFAEIIDDEIDTIILNSIVQYFPDVHYFAKVIEAAVRALGDHGAIFVGDIRNLTFLEAFHTDLQVEKSPASFSTEQLRFNIKKGIALEQELVIDPMLFHFLKEQVPQIKSIQILLRKGVHLNEMTRFRYDAILYVGKERSQAAKAVLDWHHDKLNLSLIRKILAEEKPAAILITRIPNARLRRALKMSALLRRTDCPTTVGGILQMLNNADEIPSVKPEEVWSLGEALEYEVNIYWDEASADGSYTAAFRQSSLKAGFCFDEEDCSIRSNLGSKSRIEDFANSPLLGRFTRQFSPQLRSFCASKLPVYMIPSSFTALNRFPIDTNGKLERRLLPEPIVGQFISDSHIVGPKTEIEKDLTEIWAQVLGIDNIDVRKTFFELGGDSIYSIHVISQAKKRGINLTAQQIFQHQSILELAAEIESKARKYDEKTSESIPRVRYSARDQQVIGQLLLSGNIEDVYPLSPFQNYVLRRSIEDQEPGLFLVHRFNIIKKTDEMGKKLDPAQFDDVFEELIQRYPLLRTSFEWEHMDQPVQLVHKTSKVSIHKRDWRKCSAEEQDRLLRVYLQEDRAVGIDLRNPNSLRLLVCHLEDSYLIVTSYSYMCFDGWSVDLLWQDFFKMLSMSNSPIEVGNLSKMNYKEYVLKMQGQKFGKATEFWKNELADYQPGNSLSKQPLPIKEEGKTEFARKHLIIRPELYESIKRYSRENNLTQNTLIQAAWIIALSRHLERNDVVIGICMTGRSSGVGNIEEMMGPTLNILPMRVKLKPDEPFEAWLKNLMHKTVELSAYESISLNKICEWNRVADSRELFESYLVFQNIGSKEILQKTKSNFYFSKMGFPLRIDFFPQSQISLHMSYYRNVLSDDVIDQLMIDMVIILKMITEMSGVSLGKIVESIMDGRKMETGKIFTYYEDYLCIRQITESENECE